MIFHNDEESGKKKDSGYGVVQRWRLRRRRKYPGSSHEFCGLGVHCVIKLN